MGAEKQRLNALLHGWCPMGASSALLLTLPLPWRYPGEVTLTLTVASVAFMGGLKGGCTAPRGRSSGSRVPHPSSKAPSRPSCTILSHLISSHPISTNAVLALFHCTLHPSCPIPCYPAPIQAHYPSPHDHPLGLGQHVIKPQCPCGVYPTPPYRTLHEPPRQAALANPFSIPGTACTAALATWC